MVFNCCLDNESGRGGLVREEPIGSHYNNPRPLGPSLNIFPATAFP